MQSLVEMLQLLRSVLTSYEFDGKENTEADVPLFTGKIMLKI